MSNRAFDQGSGHDAALGRWLFLLGWFRGGFTQDVVDIQGPRNPLAIFEDLRLELGSHIGKCVAWQRGAVRAVLPVANDGHR